jgi:hypothetical protein
MMAAMVDAPRPPTSEPTADEIDALRHRLTRVFAGLRAPANHIVAATCFLMGIQGRHGGRATLPQVQAIACAWIERGWKAYDRWSVVDMPKELGAAPSSGKGDVDA